MSDDVFFPILLGVFVGGVTGTVVGILVVLRASPFTIRPVLKVNVEGLGATVVEAWLDKHGLVAMPKGVDFKPARKPRSSA